MPKRFLRFSLRTLLILVMVFGIWLGFKVSAARRQKEVVDAILKAGGTVFYDYQVVWTTPRSRNFDASALPSHPVWLRNIVGDDFLFNVAYVSLDGSVIPESDLAQISNLPGLWRLRLDAIRIRDGSSKVRAIQDADLDFLGHLTELRELLITRNPEITGSGLASLAGLKHLFLLQLSDTGFNDEGLIRVGQVRSLELLVLNATRISDKGLKYLGDLSQLRTLSLNSTAISDAGVKDLCKLKSLNLLLLAGTQISDVGLRQLKDAENLKQIRLTSTH